MTRYLALAIALSGCDSPPPAPEAPPPEAPHHEEESHDELPTRVRLPDDVAKAARIATAKVIKGVLPVTVELTGEITFDPDATAEVPARAPGRIVDVRFKEGARVRAGELLAVIESPELSLARAGFTSARARAGAARQNAGRVADLAKGGLSSGQEVASAEAEAAALEAESQAAEQRLSAFGVTADQRMSVASRLEIRAPLAGVVLRRSAVRGQSVEASTVVAVVADLSRAYFLARLFEKDLARIKEGAKAEVRLNAYDGALTGVVETVGREVDAAARTVIARISITDSTDRLRVGLFGTARVSTSEAGEDAARLLVPASAVTKIGSRTVVFVKHSDGDFEVHEVTLGRGAEGAVEVLTGLRETEEVVTEGVFTVKSVLLKSTFGEDD